MPVETSTPTTKETREGLGQPVPTPKGQKKQEKTPNPFDAFEPGSLRRSARRSAKRKSQADQDESPEIIRKSTVRVQKHLKASANMMHSPKKGAAGKPSTPGSTPMDDSTEAAAPQDPSQVWMTKLLKDMETRYHARLDEVDGTIKGSEKRLGDKLKEVETELAERIDSVEVGFDDVTSEVKQLKLSLIHI